MDELQYITWKKSRTALLIADNETEDFISYLMNWMDCIKGRREADLLDTYHPHSFTDEGAIFDFIHLARYFPEGLPIEDCAIQTMDSAFFLYRPCLKMQYLVESKD